MTETLRRTPLHSRHLARGAKMADFGGWDMPIEYSGVLSEHLAVRATAAIFDVSHMGKVAVRGEGSREFLNSILTNDLDRIVDGQAQYSMLCDESGGVIDDLIVYRWNPSDFLIIPNASNASSVVSVLTAEAPAGVIVENLHDARGIIAVQGPHSPALVASLGLPVDHEYMSIASARYQGQDVFVCRSGYTGERGYEIVAPAGILPDLWDDLLTQGSEFGVIPAGLGARDTLRTEMGYPLHGHELSAAITPLQARVGWAVGWHKPEFHGREALMAEKAAGPSRVLQAVRAVDRSIPRPGMQVRSVDSAGAVELGEMTSGTFSPTLKCGIGLALVDPAIAVGDRVVVDVRGRPGEFEVVATPFVTAHTR